MHIATRLTTLSIGVLVAGIGCQKSRQAEAQLETQRMLEEHMAKARARNAEERRATEERLQAAKEREAENAKSEEVPRAEQPALLEPAPQAEPEPQPGDTVQAYAAAWTEEPNSMLAVCVHVVAPRADLEGLASNSHLTIIEQSCESLGEYHFASCHLEDETSQVTFWYYTPWRGKAMKNCLAMGGQWHGTAQ